MENRRIPGFTADASLVASTKRWGAQARPNTDNQGVVPQICDWWPGLDMVCCSGIFPETLVCFDRAHSIW
jgi:hypothetical protein